MLMKDLRLAILWHAIYCHKTQTNYQALFSIIKAFLSAVNKADVYSYKLINISLSVFRQKS